MNNDSKPRAAGRKGAVQKQRQPLRKRKHDEHEGDDDDDSEEKKEEALQTTTTAAAAAATVAAEKSVTSLSQSLVSKLSITDQSPLISLEEHWHPRVIEKLTAATYNDDSVEKIHALDCGCVGTLEIITTDKMDLDALADMKESEIESLFNSRLKDLESSTNDDDDNSFWQSFWEKCTKMDEESDERIVTVDCLDDIKKSEKYVRECKKKLKSMDKTGMIMGEIELFWWANNNLAIQSFRKSESDDHNLDQEMLERLRDVPSPCDLTKLRRLLMPILVQVVAIQSEENNSDTSVKNTRGKKKKKKNELQPRTCVGVCKHEKSVFDYWMGSHSIRPAALTLLQLYHTRVPNYDALHDMLFYPHRHHEKYFSTQMRYQFQQVQDLILATLRRVHEKIEFRKNPLCLESLDLNDELEFCDIPSYYKCGIGPNTSPVKSQPPIPKHFQTTDQRCIKKERRNMIKEFLDRDLRIPAKLFQGNVLITESEDGMTEDEFLTKTHIMQEVNNDFPRYFIPRRSRPRCAGIGLDPNSQRQLRGLFFDNKGRLRKRIFDDISLFGKFYYITFSNEAGGGKGDERWQVPIKYHTYTAEYPTRSAVEQIATKAKLITPEEEDIHDLGLLIGGTTDQGLHHDINRQHSCWLPEPPSKGEKPDSTTLGWEVNRLIYNADMGKKSAPASFLISMNRDQHEMKVGVQKDQIERLSTTTCRIKNGKPYEVFDIVRENEHLVVLDAKEGCCFTGDFPHAGVRNVDPGSKEEELLNDLFHKIRTCEAKIKERSKQNAAGVDRREILDIFASFKDLDKLTRLHFSTELKTTDCVIPRNSVGFSDCYSNV